MNSNTNLRENDHVNPDLSASPSAYGKIGDLEFRVFDTGWYDLFPWFVTRTGMKSYELYGLIKNEEVDRIAKAPYYYSLKLVICTKGFPISAIIHQSQWDQFTKLCDSYRDVQNTFDFMKYGF